MRRRAGLGSRIAIALSLFAVGVALLFAGIGHAAMPVIEDHISDHLLSVETVRALRFVAAHGTTPPPDSLSSSYLGVPALPEALRDEVAALAVGRHELDAHGRELWVSRTSLSDGRTLFVVYDAPDAAFDGWKLVVAIGATAIGATGLLLAAWTARRATRPIAELASTVHDVPPARLADALAALELDDELQTLVDRLIASLRAIDERAAREASFSRYASHELRSPVTVIRGAVEILRDTNEAKEPAVSRPLDRIERATSDMQSTIEALLWLARERTEDEPHELIELGPVVERVVERYRHLLVDKAVDAVVERGKSSAVRAPLGALEIVLGNLVANAFHFTERGQVTIGVDGASVSVADSGPGIGKGDLTEVGESFVRGDKSVGYGLGLSIVRSLCHRLGWTITLRSELGLGTRAILVLATSPRPEDGARP
jgi:signal transduction histidine kinase